MTAPLHNQIEQAYATFVRQRDALAAIGEELATAETTVTSKNRAVAVTVDSRAALSAVKFPTSAYRSMPAVELGNLIVETVEAARSRAAEQTMERYRSVLPPSLAAGELVDGNFDIDAMMARAARIINDPHVGDLLDNRTGHRDG